MILILDNGREYSDHAYCIVDIGAADPAGVRKALNGWQVVCAASDFEEFEPGSVATLGEWVWASVLYGRAPTPESAARALAPWLRAGAQILADLRRGMASSRDASGAYNYHRRSWPDEQELRCIEMALFGVGSTT